jgi:hypothetical protein
MNKLIKQVLAVAAATACSLASAGVVNFNGFGPDIFGGGDTLTEGSINMTVLGAAGGLSGALLDGADPFSCFAAACPGGNSSLYFAGLNDGGLNIAHASAAINVSSLHFGFIAPLPMPGLTGFGQLVLQGLFADGSSLVTSRDFGGADAAGNFTFSQWDVSGAFANARFSSINIFACLFTDTGDCVNPADNQAQFGVDNITYVPEPGTLALVGLSLAGLAAASRRRRQSV